MFDQKKKEVLYVIFIFVNIQHLNVLGGDIISESLGDRVISCECSRYSSDSPTQLFWIKFSLSMVNS